MQGEVFFASEAIHICMPSEQKRAPTQQLEFSQNHQISADHLNDSLLLCKGIFAAQSGCSILYNLVNKKYALSCKIK